QDACELTHFFFSSRRRHTRFSRDWSSDVCSSDLDLHYVDDSQPGISRRRLRGKFVYFNPQGERIRDPVEVRRIDQLAIPPAYQRSEERRVGKEGRTRGRTSHSEYNRCKYRSTT